jgi:hypothetical protein
LYSYWRAPKFLDRVKCESRVKPMEKSRVGASSVARSTLRGKGACWSFRMGLGRMTSTYLLTQTYTNPPISWLMHCWSTFGARTSHGQIRTHKIHHGPNLGEATTFPLIVYFVPLHEAHIQMTFCPETPKWESWNCQCRKFRDFGVP